MMRQAARAHARRLASVLSLAAVLLSAGVAGAQGAGRRRPAPPPRDEQKPAANADEEEDHSPLMRTEPEIAPPADPLALPPDSQDRIGSDWDGRPPSPEGLSSTRWFPYYEHRTGDARVRILPPLYLEHTRGIPDPSQKLYGVPKQEDTEGLYGLLYYRRRSLQLDMDVLFPALWRVRDRDNHVLVLGPLMHREAPGENDNWLAPLYFAGSRSDGGYLHLPLLLTTSHWGAESAFTLVGPYFRSRSGPSVDMGIAPLFFRGDNGNVEGGRRSYTFIPPLFYYHSEHEIDSSSTTVLGPVIAQSDAKRSVFDFAPFFFHIEGKPETGGVNESHTTVFPFFHYGYDPEASLFILPIYYRRVSRTADTMLTPIFSQAEGRNGATKLTAIGPVVPIWWNYRDRDLGLHAWAVAPFFYHEQSPAGHDWLTPLVGRFETYGESRTWWVFPTLTLATDRHGWEDDFHPILYLGRSDDSSHTVVAPVFWDFANPKGRTTVGFPLYWRFADTSDDSVVQVAANTLYIQKRAAGGQDWQFHLLPLFSYGADPNGYFWNFLFGFAGYSRDGAHSQVRALWIPIDFGGPRSSTVARE